MEKKHKNIEEFMSEILPETHLKTKIAIMGSIFSGFDGIGRVMEMQTKNLSEKSNITIYTLEGNLNAPEGSELQIIGAPHNIWINRLYRLLLPFNIPLIWRYCVKLSEYDYIIAHQYPLSFLAWLSKVFNGNQYIYWHYHTSEGYSNPFHRIYMSIIEYLDEKSFLVKKADYVCSISEYSRKELKRKSGKDSYVVYCTVDPSFKKNNITPQNVQKIRPKLSIENEQIILFVGRINPAKNIQTLIKVFNEVKNVINDVKLVIVGKILFKKYFYEIQEMIDSLEISDSVIFTGYVEEEELPLIYAACDVYATCSVSEGFNLPIVEAQNSGKTVVAFDIPAHQEVVKSGYLINEGDIDGFSKAVISVLKGDSG
jgi:glycosyltransferase involved in cell wall biosynthesis